MLPCDHIFGEDVYDGYSTQKAGRDFWKSGLRQTDAHIVTRNGLLESGIRHQEPLQYNTK
jgi:hypothetical protein